MTTLYYLEDFNILERPAKVVEVVDIDDKKSVILDETIFYPQGGGQPYDTGTISSLNAEFTVEQTRYNDGIVHHIGAFSSGTFAPGDAVDLHVDADRRLLNSKLHSAGHVADMALVNLGIGWIPGKGFHFPQGPYVEYAGSLEGIDVEDVRKKIEDECNRLITEGQETKIVFINKDKPERVVLFNDYGVPCGGTHVPNTNMIESMSIRKIKAKKGVIQVKYDIAR